MATYTGWKAALTAALGKVADTTAVHQIILTAPLTLTVPAGFPAGQVYRVTLTQDGTGGHTVTYGGQPVTVDTTAGAQTEVELWPNGTATRTVVYPGAAGAGVDAEGVQDVVGAMVVAAGGAYNDTEGTITLPSSGDGTSGPLASFSTLPASPVQWQPYEYRYTDATVWPGTIVWASGQPATLGWGIATLMWDGTRWCGEWTTMFGTNTAGGGTSYAPTVTLQTPTKTNLQVSQPFTTSDPDGDPVTVMVDWGDGTAPHVTTNPASHTYELIGTYTAWFTPNDGFQNGTPVSSSYQVTAPDTTAPLPGTLAPSSPTGDGFTLTVSAASDSGVGLHAKPYRFSTNNGGAYTDWQASPSLAFTGLLPGTSYTARHQVRDAVGNTATGTEITATTGGTPTTLAEAIVALGAAGFWKLDETSGTTITDYSGNNRHGSLTGTAGTDYILAGQDGQLVIPNGTGRVSVPDADAFTIVNGMSWFGITRMASEKSARLIRKEGEFLVAEAGARLEAGAQSASLQWVNYSQTPDGAFHPAQWKAWAVTMGAPTNGTVPSFYLNNGTAQQFAVSGTATYGGNRTTPLEIGGLWGAYSHFAVFPRQLSASEIQQLMDLALAEGRRVA